MHCLEMYSQKDPDFQPLRLVVSGTAGSGKSYLIKCLIKFVRNYFNNNKSVQVVCPTGNAANIINGVTIHRFLKVPTQFQNKEMSAPCGSAAEQLQKNLNGLKVLLVDERSLVGSTTLGWMEFMCRHGVESGSNSHLSWGGMPVVVFFGDDVQLPPVLDAPVYNCSLKSPAALHGVVVWKEFKSVINLSTVIRQKDNEAMLKSVLFSLRDYSSTSEHCKWLQKFQWLEIKSKYGNNCIKEYEDNALFVFPTHCQVWQHNKSKLSELNNHFPVATIKADFKGRHSKNEEDSNVLLPVIFLCKNAKVMLTVNLCVEYGLFNGAVGIVNEIIYLEGRRPPEYQPDLVLVSFPSYTGPPFIENSPKIVPVFPVERRCNCLCFSCKRKQIPLRLGWATTIHKCQGMTIGEGEPNRYIVIDPGNRSFECRNPGALFVALSRAKSTGNNLVLPDFAWNSSVLINDDRICCTVNTKTKLARDVEIKRLTKLASETRTKYNFLLSSSLQLEE